MEDRTGPQDGQRADDGSQRRHRRSRGRGRPPGSPGEAGAPQQEPRAPQQGPQREPRRERPPRGEETERTERAPHAREERTGGRPPERRRDRPPREQAPVIEQRPPRDQKDAREAAKAAVEQPPSRRPAKRRRSVVRTIAFIGLALLLVVVLWRTMQGTRGYETIPYSKLVTEHIASGQIERITVTGDRLLARLRGSERDRLVYLGDMEITPAIADAWTARGIAVEFRPTGSAWRVFLTTLPYLAIIVVILFLFRQAQGGSRGIFAFGKSRARELTGQDVPRVTFTDVAGIEEAKQELQEIVEFLRDPERFQRLGGKIPRGVIMIGPPGTGKTYLARAIAGEAQVPFFYISGSDFVEMFVGVGASRVRDLFEQAKAKAPCIIFIDEIDAVGRHRGAGLGGGHDEREQTLNQLLVEMDGFSSTTTVILVAATNRPDVLDPALLRPGRFDRQVFLDMPDLRGREGILKIHTRRVPLAADVDLHAVAKGTPGLSGADLRNLVNEAALLAARRGRQDVGMTEFERAKEKVMWGMERRSLVMSDQERRLTSVHEAGHALVALFTPEADPPHKVSIVPRGRALGLTAFLPDDERHTVTRSWCEAKLMSILGGRAAEEIVFGEISNGGANDLETATELSRRMICDWGMSDRLGPVMIGKRDEEIFIGKDLVQTRAVSDRTLQTIDEELRRIIDGALRNARTLLEDRRDLLEAVAEALLVHEALDRAAIDEIVRARAGRVAAVPIIVEEGEPSRPRVVERRASGIAAVSERPADVRPEPQPEQAPEEPRPERERRPRRQERAPEPAVEAVDTRPEIVEAREDVSEPFVVPAVVRAPVPIYTPPKPTEFGRRPKVVRRFGLPSSKVPESGQEVSTFIRAEITYGRALRPVEAMFIPEESAEPSAGAPENSTAEAPSVAEIAAAPEIEIVAERPAEEPIAKDTMPAGEVTEAALSIVEPEPMPDSAPVVADVEPDPPPAAANVEPPPPESEPGAVEAEAPVRPPRRRRRRTKAAAEEPSETAEGAAVEADVVVAPEFGREPRPAADETKERTEELVEAASTGERPPAAEDTPAEENAKRPAEEALREVAEAPSDKGTEKPAGEEGERPAGA